MTGDRINNAATLLENFTMRFEQALSLLEQDAQSPYPVQSSCFPV